MYEKNNAGYYKNRHSCFLLSYHLVLVTKYRNPVLTGEVKELVSDTIRAVLEERGCILTEINGESDHIHVLFDAGPAGSCPGDKNKDFPFCEKPL